jgi:hypothetical protein
MMQTTTLIGEVDYQGVVLAHFKCSCGSDFYCRTEDVAEVKSCGHEKAKRDRGSFVNVSTGHSSISVKPIVTRIQNGTATESDKELAASLFKGVVRRGAYRLWEAAGRPDGRADEFWFRSEAMFRGYLASL